MERFSNLSVAMSHLKAQSYQDDRLKAAKLKRAASLPKPKPGSGPRVAR